MNESEFRSRLYKLFDNNFIYNNPLSDELDIILKELIENEYIINKLTYRELLRCFAVKQGYLKLGVYPIVDFMSIPKNHNTGGFFQRNGNNYFIIMNYNIIDQNNALIDMERILHELEHMTQSLVGHENPAFHFMIKDHLLGDYFNRKYYSKNYGGILYEIDAFQTAREEIYDYTKKNIPSVFENFKNIEETQNSLLNYIYPDEYSNFRIINRSFNNYKEFKNYSDVDQIFDKFMMNISNNQSDFITEDNFFDINEMNISLGMQYGIDGKYKNILDFAKSKNKCKKKLEEIKDTSYEDERIENKKDYLQGLIESYDSFIYSRSYSPFHIARELLSFSKYQGKDIKLLEEMYLVLELFTDMVLNSNIAYEQSYGRFVINDEDLDYIDLCIKQINSNNTFNISNDEYFKKIKNDIYKNSIEILELLKESMLERKRESKIRKYLK